MRTPNLSTRSMWRSAIFATLILLTIVFGLVLTPPTTFGATGSITFAVIGDYGSGNGNEAAVANMVKSWNPSFVITTGDDYYSSAGGSGSTKYDMSTGKYYCPFLRHHHGGHELPPAGWVDGQPLLPLARQRGLQPGWQ